MLSSAVADWKSALSMWRLWIALGHEDIVDRYRRSLLGAAWIVLSFTLFVVVKISVFGQMANVPPAEFGLFVTIGFGVWSFISAALLDGCAAFIHSRHWILGASTPYPVFILQALFRNLLIFAAMLAVVLAAVVWKGNPWTLAALSVIPALLVYVVTTLWLSAILAPLCARFRDAHHAIQTGMRLMFFVTPILWMPAASPQLEMIAALNPVTHFIEIMRAPLLYGQVPLESWRMVALINLAGLPAGLLVYARTRSNIVFWV
ncbi:ABC transporter permease [Lysobacter fragariae]